ncbi:DNA replication and repair protein RecN [Caldanaerovirga acetigignens]|uniref:DNA repair protein RecN n=1 Tax=Caldanaerovirga acetigignens TaxID=447595 RepID=A0A1M7JF64_9FIRM|nr:DNA repair protein RecN [Caldanaerovirga acetigignens]SHM51167.1 DNA replication and repair protein RecN [Caldanaerovirga acetigignens]
MLLKLIVKDFALIDDVEIEFKEGLNVLTGETGAGKSIIIDAIGMILGERASSEYIRSGKEFSVIEAVFEYNNPTIYNILTEMGIEQEDNLLIISRKINQQGKNYCRINGISVPVSTLKALGKNLVDIHGQHQHQSLLNPEKHLEMLDLLGGKELQEKKEEVRSLYKKIIDTENKLRSFVKAQEEFLKYKEQLKLEVDELEMAQLKPGEDLVLERELEILEHYDKILRSLNFSLLTLYEGDENSPAVVDNVAKVVNALDEVVAYFSPIKKDLDSLRNILYELEDVVSDLRDHIKTIDFEPGKLDEIQARISFLNRLRNKYNKSIDELIKYKEQAASKLEEALNIDEEIIKLENSLEILKQDYIKSALELHKLRKTIASIFEKNISRELKDLGMKDVKFSVDINWIESEEGVKVKNKTVKIGEKGLDTVEFLISTNPGEPLKPLAKIVSGGEASRILLALKSILAQIDNIPCLIFDEIDVGIGGRMSQIVGEKLFKISRNHQVLCVTHSPQIASLGDAHFCINKISNNDRTFTTVKEIKGEERIKEISRMLGGTEITDKTIAHAKEMLELAEKIKRKY